MRVKGMFEIQLTWESPYDDNDGVTLGRANGEKVFSGPLTGRGRVQMLSSRTPVPNSAGYVALERIEGSLGDRRGSFALVHMGLMTRGERSLTIAIVPDSGTGQLAGITGRMDIQIVDGQHHYELDYSLPD